MSSELEISRPLAPEDIRVDQYVTVLHMLGEHLPCNFDASSWQRPEPLRILWLPPFGVPAMKVLEVCLPFVLVKDTDGDIYMLDVRRYRLARVSSRFGRESFSRMKAKRRADRKRKKADNDDDDDDDD